MATWPNQYDNFSARNTQATDKLGERRVQHDVLHNDIGGVIDALQQIVGLDTKTPSRWDGARWSGQSVLAVMDSVDSGSTVLLNAAQKTDPNYVQSIGTQLRFGFSPQGTSTLTTQLTVKPNSNGLRLELVTGSTVAFTNAVGAEQAAITQITDASGPVLSSTRPIRVPKGTQPEHTAQVSQAVPVGTVIMWGGSLNNIPAGWQLCDGSACRSSELTAAIGRSTVPDLRNRFVLGHGTRSPYATGGAESVTLSAAQMPNHTHSVGYRGEHDHHIHNAGGHAHHIQIWATKQGTGGRLAAVAEQGGPDAGSTNWAGEHNHGMNISGNHNHELGSAGSSHAHENMPPFIVLAYVIRF